MKRFKFFEGDGGGNASGGSAPAEIITPVVDHAAKIATLEERQGQQETKLFDEISKARNDLSIAIDESRNGVSDRIASLEDKLAELLAKVTPVETPPEPETPPAPSGEPEVTIETPPKTTRKIRRNGRVVKRES